MRPLRSKFWRLRVCSRASASITMLPGPVSNAMPAGITVILAMPPMLSAMRVRRGCRNSRQSTKGTSGPPRPPAAGALDGARIELAQLKIQPRDFARGGRRIRDGQDGAAHFFGIGRGLEADSRDTAAVNLNDGHVDAVERGAAHDAGYTHARLNSSCNSARRRSASTGRNSSIFRLRMRSAMV